MNASLYNTYFRIINDPVLTGSTVPANTPEVGGREPGYGSGPSKHPLEVSGEGWHYVPYTVPTSWLVPRWD